MLKILLVDDSVNLLKRIEEIFADDGMEVEIEFASDETTVGDKLTNHQYDAIFLDVQIGKANGIVLLQQIKYQFPENRVIMLTNNVSAIHKNVCLQLGACAFLDKSNDFEQIPNVLKTVMVF
jgi:DNA-binding response OmpR family regulator